MIQRLTSFLSPPNNIEDDNQRQIAILLQTLILIFLLGVVLVAISAIVLAPAGMQEQTALVTTLIIDTVAGVVFVAALLLVRRGYVRLVSYGLILVLILVSSAILYQFNGLRDPVISTYFISIILAGVLLREGRRVIQVTVFVIGMAFLIYLSEANGFTVPAQSAIDINGWAVYAIAFFLMGLLVRSAILSLINALNRAQENERALARVNLELEGLNETLEARVAERTRALELSAEISRRLSTILDQEQLIEEVVSSVQQAFDYYHVQIYLLDKSQEVLKLMGGTGSPGRVMVSQRHQLALGQGLVGQAAKANFPAHAPDVSSVSNWVSNPLLPKTRSEAAIPIAYGEDVLGVLDVQDDEVNGLTTEDVQLLQTLANQVAIALQNATLYAGAQAQAQQEALINQITQKIQETTTVEGALQIAVREIGRAVKAQQAHIRLNNALLKESPHHA